MLGKTTYYQDTHQYAVAVVAPFWAIIAGGCGYGCVGWMGMELNVLCVFAPFVVTASLFAQFTSPLFALKISVVNVVLPVGKNRVLLIFSRF